MKVDLGQEEKGYELDVVVEGAGEKVGGRTRLIAIGEAKASHVMRTRADLDRLERLRGQLAKRAEVSQAKLLLFGRSGFDSDLRSLARARRDVELVDLARLYEGDDRGLVSPGLHSQCGLRTRSAAAPRAPRAPRTDRRPAP